MGTSSARPDNLEDFAKRSHHADGELQSALQTLTASYNAFVSENEWGVLDANALLRAFGRYLHGNDFTARWVAGIAAAFRAAGGNGAIARLPDAAIKASLRLAGLDHARHSVTFDKPVAYGSPPTTGYTDDPINTATGNFVEIEHDLVCGGLVDGLSCDRTYNSRSERLGAFGRGWASWATTRLVARPDGVEYAGPDGQEALFPRMGDGYGRVVGVEALVEPLESGLALRWFDGRRWEFDEAGRPVSASRGPGTEIRFTHDTDGRLVALAHAGGKHVRLEWDEDDGRIASLECSDGRRASYRYDDADNLVEVDGEGGTRRYELDESGRVVSIVDADGVVELVNTYDEDGRVLEQLSPFGRRTQLGYLPGRVTVTMDDHEDSPVNTYIHDAEGRLLTIVDGNDEQLSVSYDDWGNPSALTERNGAVTVQEWDDRSRPVRRVLPTGVTYTFAYDDAGRLVEVEASSGAVTRYSYGGDERIPAEVVDAEGGITRRTVQDGLVRRSIDPDGVTVDFDYDADGNVVAATDGDGNAIHLERDAAGRLIAEVTPLGRRSAYFYDANGLLVERHDPTGAAWRYGYTTAGRLASVIDPTGAREEIRYGAHGLPAATVDALGHATAREYDRFGNLAAVVEPDGTGWRYAYDALMRLTTTVDPAGERWQREYDVNGTLVASSDPAGTRVTGSVDAFGRITALADGLTSTDFEFDDLGRVVAQRWPDGTQERAEYDLLDRRTLIEDAAGAVTRFAYTPGGRLARIVSPSGRVDAFDYDACGRLAAHTDGAGRRWEYRYDADGALVETRLPTGETERLVYDEAGRLAQWSSPGSGVTSYERDAAGRVVAITDRQAGTRRFEYDAGGRVVETIDANGATTRYAYNERGWLTELTDPLGGTVTRRYDALGRLVEVADQLGRSATITYDAAGRVTEQVDATGRTTCRSYDIAGRVTSVGSAGQEPITAEYDERGRMIAIDEPGVFSNRLRWDAAGRLVERSRGDMAMRWAYDADGERAAIGYPDGTETTYTRDAGGYVIAAQHPALGAIDLERDAAGRLIGASADGMRARWGYEGGDLARYEMRAGGKLRTAQLMRDPIGRIVEATIDGQPHEFAYDAAGQLVAARTPAGVGSFSYDADGRLAHEESPSGAVDYEYDAAGQLVSRTGADAEVTSYEYDAAGRRVRESGPDLERRYDWDDLGRLTEVSHSGPDDADAHTTRVVVDALGELASLDGTPMLWDTASPLSPLTWDGAAAVVGEASPWALASGGAAQWLAPDWQGTIGDVARDPWGAAAGIVGAGPHLGYRGEVEFAGETWLRNRVYHPASRAFQQPDPFPPDLGTVSAVNPYHYAANNPIGLSDPLGLHAVSDKDLEHIRNRMDRNLLQRVDDAQSDVVMGALHWTDEHASDISAVTGTLALVPTPLSPLLAGVSIAAGSYSAIKAFAHGKITTGLIELAATAPGVGGFAKASRAGSLVKAADTAERSRLSTFAKDAYRDRLAGRGLETQAAKQEAILRRRVAAERAEATGRTLDKVAAAAASTTAWVIPHPHEHEPHPEVHQPHPVHLKPLQPWAGRE
jgi:RHS repeat-associated protein